MSKVCTFKVLWHYNDQPDDIHEDVSQINLEPHYTVDNLTAELESVIETERRVNKKSTIVYYEIKFE